MQFLPLTEFFLPFNYSCHLLFLRLHISIQVIHLSCVISKPGSSIVHQRAVHRSQAMKQSVLKTTGSFNVTSLIGHLSVQDVSQASTLLMFFSQWGSLSAQTHAGNHLSNDVYQVAASDNSLVQNPNSPCWERSWAVARMSVGTGGRFFQSMSEWGS